MTDGVERLEERVSVLTQQVANLDELVDGQAEWSHRQQLHLLRNALTATAIAAETTAKVAADRDKRSTRIREWGGFVLAAAAIAIALWGG